MAPSQETQCEKAYRNAKHSAHEIERSRLIDTEHGTADGTVVLQLVPNESDVENKNAWAQNVLADMAAEGFVATSVGDLTAWFKPINAGLDL